MGRLTELEATLRRARDISTTLVKADPRNPGYLRYLSIGNYNLSEVLVELGRKDEAKEASQTAVELMERPDVPAKPAYKFQLAKALQGLAQNLHDRGEMDGAETALRKAIAITEKLANDLPHVFWYSAYLGEASASLGATLKAGGRLDEAEQAFRKSLTIAQKLAAELTSHAELPQHVAFVHARLAGVLWEKGDHTQAREHWRSARKIWEQPSTAPSGTPEIDLEQVRFLSDCPDPALRDPARAVFLARNMLAQRPESGFTQSAAGL
jgi:tetratricopeptide (TPR) repeat protein